MLVYRPPDAAGAFSMNNNNLRFSQHSPADFFVFDGEASTFYVLECKTIGGASVSFERDKSDKGIIHHYQIESLIKFSKYNKVVAGFLIDFRKSDKTYFLLIDEFLKIMNGVDKKSFNEKDMYTLSKPIEVEKKKLKTNYRYNVERLFEDIQDYIRR